MPDGATFGSEIGSAQFSTRSDVRRDGATSGSKILVINWKLRHTGKISLQIKKCWFLTGSDVTGGNVINGELFGTLGISFFD